MTANHDRLARNLALTITHAAVLSIGMLVGNALANLAYEAAPVPKAEALACVDALADPAEIDKWTPGGFSCGANCLTPKFSTPERPDAPVLTWSPNPQPGRGGTTDPPWSDSTVYMPAGVTPKGNIGTIGLADVNGTVFAQFPDAYEDKLVQRLARACGQGLDVTP